ncbi:phage head-tail joining protein [Paenirhodobacter populi]|uniref:phage head-tail joining protein n=1 Tax=Paenirhodobacter populi TaxID=2306993 RepID=UPI000FE32F8B|nr:hypothetical protein [Sinirhodobacter populi]RWR07703.1 hypothetical protein D2T32_11540 [Sinirhodobacter populi]
MPTVDEMIQMREALIRARSAGTRKVTFSDGRAVEYVSGSEMADALSDIERRIAAAASPRRPGSVRFSTSKGF